MKRLFVAIDLDPSVLETLSELSRRIEEGLEDGVRIKWTRTPQMHVTLKFLGDTDEEAVEPLADVLDEIAARNAAFEVLIEGMGCFPRPDRPRVIWAGFDEESVADRKSVV